MAHVLHQRFAVSSGATRSDIAAALDGIASDDITKKSPITAGVPEAAISFETTDEGRFVTIKVEGHPGEWSKTSERALKSAIEGLDVVGEHVETVGGYDYDPNE